MITIVWDRPDGWLRVSYAKPFMALTVRHIPDDRQENVDFDRPLTTELWERVHDAEKVVQKFGTKI